MRISMISLRRAELARLRVTDIDGKRNVIHVQGGKARKDRNVMIELERA